MPSYNNLPSVALSARQTKKSVTKYYQYGWYWHPTPRVKYTVTGLALRGIQINIWETPQIAAVCALLGLDRFPLPPDFLPEVHDLFCTVAGLRMHFSKPVPSFTEVRDAVADVSQIKSDIEKAIARIERTSSAVSELVIDFSDAHAKLSESLHSLEQLEEFFEGFVKVPLRAFAKIEGAGSPEEDQQTSNLRGRTPNWPAQVVAMKCADIYKTAFGSSPKVGDGHKSFQSFLEAFSIGLPDAERADKRRLARLIQRDGYGGEVLG